MKRVCLTGVESTGKSTLAPLLAAHFADRCAVALMPELGRSWAELHGTDFSIAALREIAASHIATREGIIFAHGRVAGIPPDLVIEDTDIVMTSAWAHMLHGARDPLLSSVPATADLYLLFAPDTPWVDDGTRMFGGAKRARFHGIITDELAQRHITPVIISGDWAQRFQAAAGAISVLLQNPSSI